jgi:hypothetical protein
MDVSLRDLVDQEILVTFRFQLTKVTRLHKAWMLRGVDDADEPVAIYILDGDQVMVTPTPPITDVDLLPPD